MNIKECEKGHKYDADVSTTCPQCELEKRNGWYSAVEDFGATEPAGGAFMGQSSSMPGGFDADIGATEPVSGAFQGFNDNFGATEPVPGAFQNYDDIGATEPVPGTFQGFNRDFGATEPVPGAFHNYDDIGATESFQSGVDYTQPPTSHLSNTSAFPEVEKYDGATQPVNSNDIRGFTPVVGWLVCIDGPDKGHDYRIRIGYNHIGRAENMDICIRGDMMISREKHALIAYDDQEKVFFFGPSEGRNIVRVNDRMAMVPTELHPYDVVTIGSSKLIFVPLCGEKFDWGR